MKNFSSWPGLTEHAVEKHLSKSTSTTKGHLFQQRQNARTIKIKDAQVVVTKPDIEHGIKTQFVYAATIGHTQQINAGYANIFATGHFMSACRRWNEKHTFGKTWTHLKSHFAAAHRQHKQMQGESAVTVGYHSANAAVAHRGSDG
jgi:hypothetical protein